MRSSSAATPEFLTVVQPTTAAAASALLTIQRVGRRRDMPILNASGGEGLPMQRRLPLFPRERSSGRVWAGMLLEAAAAVHAGAKRVGRGLAKLQRGP